jgi:hypothetical protein
MSKEIETELYKPFQRLDFKYSENYKKLYIRVRIIVLLHDGEKVATPRIVKAKGRYHTQTLLVSGQSTGEIRPRRLEYYIEFIQMPDIDNAKKTFKGSFEDLIRKHIHNALSVNYTKYFIVNTKITKNPTEEVTNTISEDGDIDRTGTGD